MTLFDLIEEIRKKCCLSYGDIVKKSHLSRHVLWKIIDQKNPNIRSKTLRKLVEMARKNGLNVEYSDIEVKIIDGRQK